VKVTISDSTSKPEPTCCCRRHCCCRCCSCCCSWWWCSCCSALLCCSSSAEAWLHRRVVALQPLHAIGLYTNILSPRPQACAPTGRSRVHRGAAGERPPSVLAWWPRSLPVDAVQTCHSPADEARSCRLAIQALPKHAQAIPGIRAPLERSTEEKLPQIDAKSGGARSKDSR